MFDASWREKRDGAELITLALIGKKLFEKKNVFKG